MTAVARLTHAELRKLAPARTFLITLALAAGLAVISVAATAAVAGRNGTPALGTDASTYQMLKLGVVCCVAMLVLGIIASGGEYRHRTIIPALLTAPRRGHLVTAKTIAVALAGAVLASVTFGLGLATVLIELSARHLHHLPPGTWRLAAGSVAAATLFGLIGVALGYITRSTIAAAVGAVGWVLFIEFAVLHSLAPNQAKWLITGTALTLTNPPAHGSATLTPATAVAVLGAYTVLLLAAATYLLRHRDVT